MKRIQHLKQQKMQPVPKKTSAANSESNSEAEKIEKNVKEKQLSETVIEDEEEQGIEEIEKSKERSEREAEKAEDEIELGEKGADQEQDEADDLAAENVEDIEDDAVKEKLQEDKAGTVLVASESVLADGKKDREAESGPEVEAKSRKGRREHKLFPGLWWVLGIGIVIILVILACILVPKMTNGHSAGQDVAMEDQNEEEKTADKPVEEQPVEEEKKPEEESPEPPKDPEPEVEKPELEPSNPVVEPRPVEYPNPEVVPGSKLIALTFDDGPSPSTTPRLLDILNSYGVKATFFVLGQMAERNPDILVRESLEGHEVASHTPYHNQLTQLSYGAVQSEALEMDRIFKNILGKVPPFTRPPYGSYNSTVQTALAQPLILWSIDPRDWQDRNASVVCSRVVSSAFDGAVILVHDIHPTTVDAVPCIIEGLRAQGYQFLTISEMAAARDIPLLSDGVYGAF